MALLIAASSGCAICASPFDKTYSAYGGRWQRDDMQHGRVGSAFYPAGGPVFVEQFPQFEMNDDLILALWPRASLAHDAKVPLTAPSASELSIGHNVHSKQEVDTVMAQAEKAGARITDRAQDRFWGGYSGYFQDPDGHVWEIAWNPQWPVKD
jgi:catechol 2,3-dioxygenase-like lactoylglutathione lyase family enzyme